MRLSHVLAVGSCLTATVFFSSPLAASASPPSDHGPVQIIAEQSGQSSGWVAFRPMTTSDVDGPIMQPTWENVQYVGGGRWIYGSYFNSDNKEVCYSRYYHATVTHGSTAELNGFRVHDSRGPGQESDAYVVGNSGTCYAWWNKA